MKRKITFLLLLLTLCGLGVFYAPPQLPLPGILRPSADLEEARERVIPRLESALAQDGFDFGQPVFIRIFKEESELELWVKAEDRFRLFKTYDICNYSGHLGPKLKEGDRQSPEGFYYVGKSALNPNSSYHLSFNLGFPNRYDRSRNRTGSYLMVHGDCLSIGCYAMTDAGIEEIYLMVEAALKAGQGDVPVHAFPFRMTDDRLAREQGHKWFSFWQNLKQGYDLFERDGVPPAVSVSGKDYAFNA